MRPEAIQVSSVVANILYRQLDRYREALREIARLPADDTNPIVQSAISIAREALKEAR